MIPPQADTAEFFLPGSEAQQVASSLVQVDLGALTHKGKVRPTNEDHFLAVRFGRSLETLISNLPRWTLSPSIQEIGYGMVVADGMGGRPGGEIASRTAITTLMDLVLNTPDWLLKIGDREAKEIIRRFEERYRLVDVAISEQAAANPDLAGMGTTMTLACSLGDEMILGHLGDSRAYLFRQGELIQLTRDHTMAQSLVEKGVICKEEAATHRWRHKLTQVVGGNWGLIDPEVQRLCLRDGDRVLLCTDGLTEMLDNGAIWEILSQPVTSQQICQKLVAEAMYKGGKDNITVILARYRIPR